MTDFKIIGLAVFLAILLVPYAESVGISNYVGDLIVYEPGKQIRLGFTIMNAERIEPYLSGDLNDYVQVIDPAPMTGQRDIQVVITFPESLDPGKYNLYVGAKEIAGEGNSVGGIAQVRTRVQILSLYPGKYPVFGVSAGNVNANQASEMTVSVTNYGKQRIEAAKSRIEIYNSLGDKVAELYTSSLPVESNSQSDLKTSLDTEQYALGPGLYTARAFLEYDGVSVEESQETKFSIG